MWRGRNIIFIIYITTHFSQARVSEDEAIANYIHPIVIKYANDSTDFAWKAGGNGGYLLKTSVDVTNDGNPEQFLTSSLVAEKYDSTWKAFTVSAEGAWNQYVDDIRLPIDGFASSPDSNGLIYIGATDRDARRGKPESEWVTPVLHLEFSFPHASTRTENIPDDAALALHSSIEPRFVKAEAILLSDYLAGKRNWEPLGQWKITSSDDRLARASDWQKATENTSFTAKVALEELEKLRPSTDIQRRKQEKPASHSDPSTLPKSDAETVSLSSEVPKWTIPVGGVFAILLLAVAILKKTKK